jgi:hypothetical protein
MNRVDHPDPDGWSSTPLLGPPAAAPDELEEELEDELDELETGSLPFLLGIFPIIEEIEYLYWSLKRLAL